MSASSEKFIKMIRHPVKFRMFLFWKLPAAFFSGVRIKEISEERSVVTVPFKWLTQNPFRSTYFASLAMAAEMSTGSLAMIHVYKHKPPVSMLITNMEAAFFKKATSKIFFTCDEGRSVYDTIEAAVASGDSKSIQVRSIGTDTEGRQVAEFLFTWSFKVKST